jgi:hypothetical protein
MDDEQQQGDAGPQGGEQGPQVVGNTIPAPQ